MYYWKCGGHLSSGEEAHDPIPTLSRKMSSCPKFNALFIQLGVYNRPYINIWLGLQFRYTQVGYLIPLLMLVIANPSIHIYTYQCKVFPSQPQMTQTRFESKLLTTLALDIVIDKKNLTHVEIQCHLWFGSYLRGLVPTGEAWQPVMNDQWGLVVTWWSSTTNMQLINEVQQLLARLDSY